MTTSRIVMPRGRVSMNITTLATSTGSIMPAYPWLLENPLDFDVIPKRVDAMVMLGVPYGAAVTRAKELAVAQAEAELKQAVGGEVAAVIALGLEAYASEGLTASVQSG